MTDFILTSYLVKRNEMGVQAIIVSWANDLCNDVDRKIGHVILQKDDDSVFIVSFMWQLRKTKLVVVTQNEAIAKFLKVYFLTQFDELYSIIYKSSKKNTFAQISHFPHLLLGS